MAGGYRCQQEGETKEDKKWVIRDQDGDIIHYKELTIGDGPPTRA